MLWIFHQIQKFSAKYVSFILFSTGLEVVLIVKRMFLNRSLYLFLDKVHVHQWCSQSCSSCVGILINARPEVSCYAEPFCYFKDSNLDASVVPSGTGTLIVLVVKLKNPASDTNMLLSESLTHGHGEKHS